MGRAWKKLQEVAIDRRAWGELVVCLCFNVGWKGSRRKICLFSSLAFSCIRPFNRPCVDLLSCQVTEFKVFLPCILCCYVCSILHLLSHHFIEFKIFLPCLLCYARSIGYLLSCHFTEFSSHTYPFVSPFNRPFIDLLSCQVMDFQVFLLRIPYCMSIQ